jgi:hypothetical protein
MLVALTLVPNAAILQADESRTGTTRTIETGLQTTFLEQGIYMASSDAATSAWNVSLSMTAYLGRETTQYVSTGRLCDGATPVVLDRGLVEEDRRFA